MSNYKINSPCGFSIEILSSQLGRSEYLFGLIAITIILDQLLILGRIISNEESTASVRIIVQLAYIYRNVEKLSDSLIVSGSAVSHSESVHAASPQDRILICAQ